MRVKKTIPYYAFGLAAIILLSMLGPLCVVAGERTISVLTALLQFPREMLQEHSLENACSACGTVWMYLLLPLAAAIPSASYLYEEITSRFYLNVELRKGRYQYAYSTFIYSGISGGITVILGITCYVLLMACIFPISPEYASGEYLNSAGSMGGAIAGILPKILYMGLYGMAMSILASLFVCLYPKLYFDLSILFIVSYMLRKTAMQENLLLPLLMVLTLAVLYGAVWKLKSRHV